MRKTRQSKRKSHDVSTNASHDVTPTSSQAPQQQSSRRRSSGFRGFDVSVDQTELVANVSTINYVLYDDSARGSCEEDTSKKVSKKKMLTCSPKPERKKLKLVDPKLEKENSTDFCIKSQAKENLRNRKSLNLSIHKPKLVLVHCTDNERKQNFIGNESKGGNFINIFNNLQRGVFKPSVFDEIAEQVTLKSLRWFRVWMSHETTDLRVTALAWHPTNPNLIVCGGKAGTLVLSKLNEQKPLEPWDQIQEIPGIGPGGTMECIRFNTKASGVELYTASVDGSISSYNFDISGQDVTKKNFLVVSPDTCRVWFCAVDIHQDGKSVYGGDNTGNLAIHHLDGGKTDYGSPHLKLHSSKIRHLEFSPKDPNLMVTSSLDKTVKMWDIRKLDGRKSCIESLVQEFGVSSAKFSRTDGCHLLTTDLSSELRVYKAPLWNLEHSIHHPHRHFQHLTVIRASWHPRADLFVVGRYPDPKSMTLDDVRSVDVYSASSAKLCFELTDTCKQITSLAEFNSTGSFLATSTGKTLHIWKQN